MLDFNADGGSLDVIIPLFPRSRSLTFFPGNHLALYMRDFLQPGCKQWFDIECMIPGPQKAWRGPLSKKIATAPVMWVDLGAGPDQWNMVGSGRKVHKMKQWVNSDTLLHNWKELLGDQFVESIVATNFVWYCDVLI